MSAEHEDLPIPSARQRIEGQWGPETTNVEKLNSIQRAIEARVNTLINIISTVSKNSDTLTDVISYLGGATNGHNANERLATEVMLDPELLDFLLRLDRYISERYLVADHEEMHLAAEKYMHISSKTGPSDPNDSEFHISRENLIEQVRFYLAYIQNLAIAYPLRQRMAKVLKGIEDPSFVTDVLNDIRSIHGFAAIEKLLPNLSGSTRLIELEDLIVLLKEIQKEDLESTAY